MREMRKSSGIISPSWEFTFSKELGHWLGVIWSPSAASEWERTKKHGGRELSAKISETIKSQKGATERSWRASQDHQEILPIRHYETWTDKLDSDLTS